MGKVHTNTDNHLPVFFAARWQLSFIKVSDVVQADYAVVQRCCCSGSIIAQVFEYIEVYYNRKRPHSTIEYLSPEAFEARQVA